jgi:predicted DNA-binding protein
MSKTDYTGFYFRLRPEARHLLAAASKKLGKDRTAILHDLIETHLAEHVEVAGRLDALIANIPVVDIPEVKA